MDFVTSPFTIPAEKLYAVVELVEDVTNDEGETDVKRYSGVAPTNWLENVDRIQSSEGKVKYVAGVCKWPKDESIMDTHLSKRTKPQSDWVSYKNTQILKFCRSIFRAKEQMNKAAECSDLSQSDVPLKRKPKPRKRFGCEKSAASDDTDDESPAVKLHISSSRGKDLKASRPRLTELSKSSNNGVSETRADGEASSSKPSADGHGSQTGSRSPEHLDVDLQSSSSSITSHFDKMPRSRSKENSIISDSENDLDQDKMSSSARKSPHSYDSTSDEDQLEQAPKSVEKASGDKDSREKPDIGQNGKCHQPSSSGKVPIRRSLPFSVSDKTPRKLPTYSPNRRLNTTGSIRTFSPRKVTSSMPSVSEFTFKREMEEMRRSLNSLKVTVNKIYNCVCPITESIQDNEDDRGLPALPVSSVEQLVTWEKFLKDVDNSLHITRLLTERCTSAGLTESVNGMLRFCVANNMGCTFNAKGVNKKDAKVIKLSFKGTRTCSAMTAAMTAYAKNMEKAKTPLTYTCNTAEILTAIGKWLKDSPKRFLKELINSKVLPIDTTAVPKEMYPVLPEDINTQLGMDGMSK